MPENLFLELTIIMALAGGVALLVSFFKLPKILAYITAGLLIGPYGFLRLTHGESFSGLAEVGITLLLFMVGLELDLRELKRVGKTAIIAGLGQVIFTSVIGFGIAVLMGFAYLPALYIGVALTFSSTIIVVKLLAEKGDQQSLYGRIVIGIFLVQDFVAVFILIGLSTFAKHSYGADIPVGLEIAIVALKALALGIVVWILSKFIFPKVLKFIGNSDELILLFSLAWALGFAYFVSTPLVGFSIEIGGFLAGLTLAGSSIHYEIGVKIRSLRDFFIIIFFVVIGSNVIFTNFATVSSQALIFSAFVLVGNPLIVLLLLSYLGYKPRTSFIAGLTVAQISEFSLTLMATGLKQGHITSAEVSLVTMVGLITFAVSSYMIQHSERIYMLLKGPLAIFDFHRDAEGKPPKHNKLIRHIVLIGAHRTGGKLLEKLAGGNKKLIVVDFNPEITEVLTSQGLAAICGDATDPYIQELAGFKTASLIVSTLPQLADNLALVDSARKLNAKTKIIATAQTEAEAALLYDQGADYVMLSHFIGGMHLNRIISDKHMHSHLTKLRHQHLAMLGR